MNNVRHLYTEWEENPDKLILRSKSDLTLLPLSPLMTSQSDKYLFVSKSSEQDSNASNLEANGSNSEENITGEDLEYGMKSVVAIESEAMITIETHGIGSVITHADSGFISVPESSLSAGSSLDDDITSRSSSHDPPLCEKPKHHANVAAKRERGRGRERAAEGDRATRAKYSPEQLKAIQSRVKDSLKNQGVYLYDPITGVGT